MAAAVHAARASPPRLQPLHPALAPPSSFHLPHHMPSVPSGMEKKHFLPLGYPGQLPPFPHPQPQQGLGMGERGQLPPDPDDFEEDIDEDDISDIDEEEWQQEFLACRARQQQQQQQLQPDMTQQLLAFAEMVNTDIQKFFGRKKGDEDSCDVYEDKWVVTKSGRELYYADLLRIAQGDFGDSKSSKDKPSTSSSRDTEMVEDNRNTFSGKADSSIGLGPLKDLFEVGLKQFLQESKQRRGGSSQSSSSKHSSRGEGGTSHDALPMHQRRLPDSFWREPGVSGTDTRTSATVSDTSGGVQGSGGVLLGAAKLPDFSDLMESWHGDHSSHPQHPHHQQMHQLHHGHAQHHHHHHRSSASETITSGSGSETTTLRRL